MEKKKIIIIFLICICYVLLNGCGKRENKQIAGSNIEYEDSGEKNMKLDKEVFMNIQYGDSFDAFSKQIGSPDKYDGKILKYAVYNLEDGGYAQVFQCKDRIQQVCIFDSNNKMTYILFDEMKNVKTDLKDKITIEDKEIYYDKKMCDLSIDDFKNIGEDYNYDDVILAVGQPVGYIGYGTLSNLYILKDGTIVVLKPSYGDKGFVSIFHYNLENGKLEMLERIK